jgi:hypothetical protein
MKHPEKITPVAAAVSALSAAACCLPSGIAAALGVAGLGVVLEPFRSWFLGLSVALLTLGFVQLHRSNRTCQPRSPVSITIFLVSAIVVVGVLVFPQVMAAIFAALFP